MKDSIDKFKKKVTLELIVKCIVYSLAISLGLVGLLFIILKRIPFDMHFILYVIIGMILTIVFSIFFYFTFPIDEVRLAKRIDKQFSLKEQVQTMIEYQDKEGLIIEIQRNKTINELNNLSEKKLKLNFSPLMFVCLFLSSAVLVSSFFVPSKEIKAQNQIIINTSNNGNQDDDKQNDDNNNQDDDKDESKSDSDKIDDIIQNVDSSTLDEQTKEDVKQELEDLKDKLENAETEEERNQVIEETKENIEQIINKTISKIAIGEALKQSLDQKLVNLGEALITGENIEQTLDDLLNELLSLEGEALINRLKELNSEINNALVLSQVNQEDPLYQIFDTFAKTLLNIANEVNSLSNEEIQNKIKEAFNILKEALIEEVNKQKENEQTKEEIKEQLDSLKGEVQDGEVEPGEGEDGDKTENPDEGTPDDGEQKGDEENEDSDSTGEGEGETIYGSNDEIYSKDGESSEYGDVIDDYYTEIVNGNTEGDTPEDIEDIIDDYFSTLYGDGKDK